MSRPDDRRPGARPAAKALAALPQACRTFLREALAAGGVPDTKHAASCAGCAERLSAALRIRSALLATPPLLPLIAETGGQNAQIGRASCRERV